MQAAATPPRNELELEDDDAEVLRQLQFIARNIWDEEDGETATLRPVPPRSPTDSVVSFAPASGNPYPGGGRRNSDRQTEFDAAPSQGPAVQRSVVPQAFAVLVQNLEPQTTEDSLFSMFFPLGALSVEFIRSGTAGRKAALVYFPMKEVADSAATKLNSFVPHGQYQPLSVTSIPLEVARLLKTSAPSGGGGAEGRPAGTPPQAPLPSARRERPPRSLLGPTPKIVVGTTLISEGSPAPPPGEQPHPPPPTQTQTRTSKQRPAPGSLPLQVSHVGQGSTVLWFAPTSGAGKLLRLIEQHDESVADLGPIDPEEVVHLYAECPDAEDITTVLVRYMAKQQHRGIALMTAVLERLAEPKLAALRAQVQQAVSRPLVRSLLSAQDKCERIGAAVVTAALFECGFIAGTPFGTAKKLLETHPSRNDPDLVDALVSMTSAWRARRSERTPATDTDGDPDEAPFRALVHRFYETLAPRSAPATVVGLPFQHPSPSMRPTIELVRQGQEDTPPRSSSSLQSTPVRNNVHNYSTDSESEALAATVYITRLPPATSEAKLRAVFTEYGEINKVRLYEDTGGRGCFGFVEFTTPTAAQKMLVHCDRRQIDDAIVRCNTARSAIHDVDPRDAIYDGTLRLRDCLFGVSPKPRNFTARRTS